MLALGVYNCAVFEGKPRIRSDARSICCVLCVRSLRIPWGMAK